LWLTNRAYEIIGYFSEIELPKNTGDFKLLSRRAVDEILKLPELDPYMRGLSIWIGFRQDFVYYKREARFKGQTKFPIFGTGPIREFIRGLTAFSAAPLYLSFVFGIGASLLSLLLIIYAIVTKVMNLSAPGVSGVIIAVSFFSGIILVTNGAMGLYVAKIYNEVKKRPKYIVKDIITKQSPSSS
jgi:dolichol-phosphate mannosyltransferase